MKKLILSLFLGAVLVAQSAYARSAEHFDGWYEIISQTQDVGAQRKEFFRLDVDSLLNIWLKYGEEGKPIPPDWEPVQNEIVIFAAFTNRDYLVLTLEANAVVTDNFLGIYHPDNGDILEIRKRGDGQSDLAIKEKGKISRYLVGAPTSSPNPLPLARQLR